MRTMRHLLLPLYLVILGFFICLSNEKSVQKEVFKQWQDYKLKFGKVYETPKVEERHLSHFVDNLKSIDYHNKREERDVLEPTKFSDQQCHKIGCTAYLAINDRRVQVDVSSKDEDQIKDHIDWRNSSFVTAVQDQNDPRPCGSCWAFSTAGTIEGRWAKSKKRFAEELSVQQLIDCSTQTPNDGCDGGNPYITLKYVQKKGIYKNDAYPYRGQKGTCRVRNLNDYDIGARIIGYKVLQKDEQELKEAVAMYGPIAVTIDISMLCHYKPGTVFNIAECYWHYDGNHNIKRPLHSVLVVGYGTDENGMDYWLIKNSWGTNWGDKGYFKLARNSKNRCGIANQAIYPILEGEGKACTWRRRNKTLATGTIVSGWSCTSNGIKYQFNNFCLVASVIAILMFYND